MEEYELRLSRLDLGEDDLLQTPDDFSIFRTGSAVAPAKKKPYLFSLIAGESPELVKSRPEWITERAGNVTKVNSPNDVMNRHCGFLGSGHGDVYVLSWWDDCGW